MTSDQQDMEKLFNIYVTEPTRNMFIYKCREDGFNLTNREAYLVWLAFQKAAEEWQIPLITPMK